MFYCWRIRRLKILIAKNNVVDIVHMTINPPNRLESKSLFLMSYKSPKSMNLHCNCSGMNAFPHASLSLSVLPGDLWAGL